MRVADQIVADIERRHEAKLGRAAYAGFIQALREITADKEAAAEKRGDDDHPWTRGGWSSSAGRCCGPASRYG
jgi:hypothetical protein